MCDIEKVNPYACSLTSLCKNKKYFISKFTILIVPFDYRNLFQEEDILIASCVIQECPSETTPAKRAHLGRSAPTAEEFREWVTFLQHNQHNAPQHDAGGWREWCSMSGFGHIWEYEFSCTSPTTSLQRRAKTVMIKMWSDAHMVNQKVSYRAKATTVMLKAFGVSNRAIGILQSAVRGTVSTRADQYNNRHVINNIEDSLAAFVEKAISERSFLIVAVDDFTVMNTVTRRDSANVLDVQKMAVAQMIVPPCGVGRAVDLDPRHNSTIDLSLLPSLFDEDFLCLGSALSTVHEDIQIGHIIGVDGMFGRHLGGPHFVQRRVMTHSYGNYNSDVFTTGRSIDHAKLIDVFMNNSYRKREEFAQPLYRIADILKPYLERFQIMFVGDHPAIVNTMRFIRRSPLCPPVLNTSMATLFNYPLHMSLNYQQTIVSVWFEFFGNLHKYLHGSSQKWPEKSKKLRSHRNSYLLECMNGGWGLIRADMLQFMQMLTIRQRKDPELSALLSLLENDIPLSLLYYSCIWLSKCVSVWRHCNRRLWMSFFCFSRRNYSKLPLAHELILEHLERSEAPLFGTFSQCAIWADDWFNEHRMCLLRSAIGKTGKDFREAAFIQEKRRCDSSEFPQPPLHNHISDATLTAWKAKSAGFLSHTITSIVDR